MRISGGLLVVVAVTALAGFAAYEFWNEFVLDPDEPLILKIAIPGGVAGLVLLLASVARERMAARKTERLDEVQP